MTREVSAIERLRRRCSRVTSPGRQFIPEIDGLRFLAIAMVVAYHLHDHLTQRHPALIPWRSDRELGYELFQQGHIGVQLFFVISGFILAMPMAKWRLATGRPVTLKTYYWRRLTRLEPPYVINLLILFALLLVVRGDAVETLVGPLLASMTYTHNVIYGEMSRINFVAWSLEIEAQFYLIAPLLGQLYRIAQPIVRRTAVLGVGVLAYVIEYILRERYGSAVPTTLLGSLIFFVIGWMLADITISKPETGSSQTRYFWDAIHLACLLGGRVGLVPRLIRGPYRRVIRCHGACDIAGRNSPASLLGSLDRDDWRHVLHDLSVSLSVDHRAERAGPRAHGEREFRDQHGASGRLDFAAHVCGLHGPFSSV